MVYISFILTLLISVILLLHHWPQAKAVIYLVILLLTSSIRPLLFYLINNQTDTVVLARLFLHLDFVSCLFGPVLFYYFRSLLKNKLVLDWALLLHLIPAVVVLINTLPYYFIPFEEKIHFVTQVQTDDLTRENHFPYLLFPYTWQKIGIPLYNLLYGGIAILYILKIRKNAKLYVKRKAWFLLTRIAWVFGIYYAPTFLFILYANLSKEPNQAITFFARDTPFTNYFYFITLILPVSFLLMPHVLYGEKQKDSPLERFWNRIKAFYVQRFPEVSKTPSESEEVDQILFYLEQVKPYLKDDFSQHDLAQALNIPQKRIADCFNKQLKVSFPAYRNLLRIQHATDLLRKGAQLSTSIEGIGALSGFKSKSTFYTAFKAVHNMTPLEWMDRNLEAK